MFLGHLALGEELQLTAMNETPLLHGELALSGLFWLWGPSLLVPLLFTSIDVALLHNEANNVMVHWS